MTWRDILVFGVAGVMMAPAGAFAQREVFVRGLAELAEAVAADPGAKPQRLAAVADRMESALAEWDGAIRALETRVAAEAAGASTATAFQLRITLAGAYLERGRLADAERELGAAIALDGQHSDAHLLRGLALAALGRNDLAVTAFARAAALDPQNPAKAYRLIQHGRGTSSPDLARARATLLGAYRAVAAAATRRTAAPFAGVDLLPDEAAPSPVMPDAERVETFDLLARREYGQAIAALRRSLAAPQPSSGVAAPAAAHTVTAALAGRRTVLAARGRQLRAEGHFEQAIATFEKAVAIAPNAVETHKDLARAYVEQDRPDDAAAELMAALLIDSHDADAHAALGSVHLDAGRLPDAAAALRRALDLNPQLHETRYALAAALKRLGRTVEAERELQAYERERRRILDERRRQIADDVAREQPPR